jgi:hypothetical protein
MVGNGNVWDEGFTVLSSDWVLEVKEYEDVVISELLSEFCRITDCYERIDFFGVGGFMVKVSFAQPENIDALKVVAVGV